MRMTDSYIDQLNGYTRPDYTITTDATSAPDKLFSLRQPATVIITGHCTQGDLNNMDDALYANRNAGRGAEIYLNLSQTDLTTVGDDTFDSSFSIEGVSLPASVETIGSSAFSMVRTAKIPNSWKLKTIGAWAFFGLKAVVIPAVTQYLWAYRYDWGSNRDDVLTPVNKFEIKNDETILSAFKDETKIYTYA